MLTFVTFLLVWLSYVGAYLFLIGAVFLGRALSVFLMPRVPHMRAKRGASGKRVFSGLQLQRLSLRNSQSTVRLPFQVLASVAFLGRGGLLTTTTAGQRVVLPLQPSLFMGSTTLTSSQL